WDGGFSYTPDLNFSGIDSFTYRADDGSATRSNEATVTIKVMPLTPPTLHVSFSSSTYEVAEGCVPATLTVTLTDEMAVAVGPVPVGNITVDYAVTGGTAS